MNLNWHQIKSTCSRSSKELQKLQCDIKSSAPEELLSEALKRQNLFERVLERVILS